MMPRGSPGVSKSREHRAAISAALTGKKKSKSHRRAISEARKDRYFGEWTEQKARDAVHRVVRRGEMPPADHCVKDPTHEGPYGYDHCGDPPYSFENRFVVQPVCNPCHQAIEAERRGDAGYSRVLLTCGSCSEEFYVIKSRADTARFCGRPCYLESLKT